MIIALTGTPGTGKTTIARLLKNKYSLELLNIHSFAKEENIIKGYDKRRQSDIIDINILDQRMRKYTKEKSILILEGHLSHLLTCVSHVILLRCHPIILQKRLKRKKWKKEKIQENIEAEMLDIIKIEALEIHSKDHVIEINTSNSAQKDIAELIHILIESNFSEKNKLILEPIDWSELFLSNDFNWRLKHNGS